MVTLSEQYQQLENELTQHLSDEQTKIFLAVIKKIRLHCPLHIRINKKQELRKKRRQLEAKIKASRGKPSLELEEQYYKTMYSLKMIVLSLNETLEQRQ